jgi:shikimate kinase
MGVKFNEPPNEIITVSMVLTLIGYRATGKTTLAKRLAQRLGHDWIDADVEIERRAGKSIARIFADDGEPAFRELEAQVIAELCQRPRLVLAAGGGSPLRPESRQAMRRGGHVVWLTAQPETILARMTADATTAGRRPNLTEKSPLDEIVELLALREPIYRESAHLVVDTENKRPGQLVDEILSRLDLGHDNDFSSPATNLRSVPGEGPGGEGA